MDRISTAIGGSIIKRTHEHRTGLSLASVSLGTRRIMMHDLGEISVRKCQLPHDQTALLAIDSSYLTSGFFNVLVDGHNLTLQVKRRTEKKYKRFPIDLNSPLWSEGWVAESKNGLVGFMAIELQPWNRRLTIWHFYVEPGARRRGIGKQLMETALAFGRCHGAVNAWAETSNCNLPGIMAYEKLGFWICGFDKSLYIGTPAENEFAIYVALSLVPATTD